LTRTFNWFLTKISPDTENTEDKRSASKQRRGLILPLEPFLELEDANVGLERNDVVGFLSGVEGVLVI
jgi:hypothetical protein